MVAHITSLGFCDIIMAGPLQKIVIMLKVKQYLLDTSLPWFVLDITTKQLSLSWSNSYKFPSCAGRSGHRGSSPVGHKYSIKTPFLTIVTEINENYFSSNCSCWKFYIGIVTLSYSNVMVLWRVPNLLIFNQNNILRGRVFQQPSLCTLPRIAKLRPAKINQEWYSIIQGKSSPVAMMCLE